MLLDSDDTVHFVCLSVLVFVCVLGGGKNKLVADSFNINTKIDCT